MLVHFDCQKYRKPTRSAYQIDLQIEHHVYNMSIVFCYDIFPHALELHLLFLEIMTMTEVHLYFDWTMMMMIIIMYSCQFEMAQLR